MSSTVTCVAPVNIAVIKYWGKRDTELILPLNDSFSATLNLDHMQAKTTVQASPEFKEDRLWLNGVEEKLENGRVANCLRELRMRSKAEEIFDNYFHICSENNFPTAAGLASSAAGYACLVFAVAKVLKVEGEISDIARLGSGSACRSIYGGFVRWYRGSMPDGSDSIAKQVFPADYWPEMRVMILVASDQKKMKSSTSGMQLSVETSQLLQYRVNFTVPERIEQMEKAIKEKDFETFAKLTIKDSNQFHAICLDTYPPAFYLKDVSVRIAGLIHSYNNYYGKMKVAYTFDAGPNACLYILEQDVAEVSALLTYIFPPTPETADYHRGFVPEPAVLAEELKSKLEQEPFGPGMLLHILHSSVGGGPQVVDDPEQHLLNEDGVPKNLREVQVVKVAEEDANVVKEEDGKDKVANKKEEKSKVVEEVFEDVKVVVEEVKEVVDEVKVIVDEVKEVVDEVKEVVDEVKEVVDEVVGGVKV